MRHADRGMAQARLSTQEAVPETPLSPAHPSGVRSDYSVILPIPPFAL
jgi:hypothetical protein